MTITELQLAFTTADAAYQKADCEAFGRLLDADLELLVQIRGTEQRWLDGLRAKEVAYDFHFDRGITEYYRRWVERAELRRKQLQLQETKGCFPAVAGRFLEGLASARETLLERLQDETSALAIREMT